MHKARELTKMSSSNDPHTSAQIMQASSENPVIEDIATNTSLLQDAPEAHHQNESTITSTSADAVEQITSSFMTAVSIQIKHPSTPISVEKDNAQAYSTPDTPQDVSHTPQAHSKHNSDIFETTSQDLNTSAENSSEEGPIRAHRTMSADARIYEQTTIPSYLRHMQEDVTQEYWRMHKKHFFILSDSGRPIFTRYGNENDLNTMMGFFLAIVSFVQNGNDTIRYVRTLSISMLTFIRTVIAGNLKLVFVVKGCLYLVAVSRTTEPASELAIQLEYIYAQIIFILTESVQDYLQKKKTFDLRNLLGGIYISGHIFMTLTF